MSPKNLGSMIAVIGVVLLLVSLAADVIGIGKEGFGPNQVKGAIAGAVALVIGIVLSRRKEE